MAKKKKNSSTGGMLFVLLLALGFLGFLFYLGTVPADGKQTAPKAAAPVQSKAPVSAPKPPPKPAQPVPVQAKPKPVAPATPKPVETVSDYDFYKLLENQTVDVPKVDAYKSTPKTETLDYLYLLQVASLGSKADADSLRASLLLEDLQAFVREAQVRGATYYRVYVGPFDDRSKMNQAQDKLVARSFQPLALKEAKKK